MNENRWTTIQQVPIGAFFRRKTRPTEIFPITGINLQYAGGMPMSGLDLKATPAVQIELVWWRLPELDQMFEYSFDCVNWHECNGVVASKADTTESTEATSLKKKS